MIGYQDARERRITRQLDIRQWNWLNSRIRPFDISTGWVCMCTRRIPNDKSSADGTFDGTGNCICNIRKLQAPFTGESKKCEAARREPRTTCRDYVQLPAAAIAVSNNRQHPLLRRVHLANALDVWCCHEILETRKIGNVRVSPQLHMSTSSFPYPRPFLEISSNREIARLTISKIKLTVLIVH